MPNCDRIKLIAALTVPPVASKSSTITTRSPGLIEKLGGEVVGCAFVIELTGLKGRELLNKYDVFSLINYEF